MSDRLHRVVMHSFRGVPGKMTVDFGPGQSIAVYRDNRTGKSTMPTRSSGFFTVDIELLSHEDRQHAICNLGGEKGAITSVEVETNGALGGTIVFPTEKKAAASAGRETFLLRGRTLADFINKTKTEKWKSLVEILRLDEVESLPASGSVYDA